ncbi:PKD domain-containing protein [Anaerolineales bacterium HSG6]|nr:PKD domain-containing protein [Anaerolineales bacterium HSG6]
MAFFLLFTLSACTFTASSAPSQTPTPLPPKDQTFSNGDFESGDLSDWTVKGTKEGVKIIVEAENHVAQFTDNTAIQQAIQLKEGQKYTATAMFRCHHFEGGTWGNISFKLINSNTTPWQDIIARKPADLSSFCQDKTWHKIALSFTAPYEGQAQLEVGVHGERTQVELSFDEVNVAAVNSVTPIPPTLKLQTDVSSGSVPLTVAFTANAEDTDGAVDYYVWQFGDGSEARIANPEHTFYQRGEYEVVLSVWDNEGNSTSDTVMITVTDATAPTLTVSETTLSTTDETLTVQGKLEPAQESGSPLISLVWDNLSTGDVGAVAPQENWTIEQIPLTYGSNEILLTALDQAGKISTAKLDVTRILNQPQITDITPLSPNQIGLYEPYEVQFEVTTVAKNMFLQYDKTPPVGVEPNIGVTVEGIISSPTGEIRQPAFFMTKVMTVADRYVETAEKAWRLRLTPQTIGTHHVALQVTDASGTSMVDVGDFEVVASGKKGFIQVSQQDPRYFEHSTGELFFPVGPALESDYHLNKNALNLARPWLGMLGIYSTNWAKWMSSSEKHGNEGYMAPLTFRHHYPSHELAYKLFCQASCGDDESDMDGWWLWMGYLDNRFAARLTPGNSYRLKIRLKMTNLTPKSDGAYGLTIKGHSWKPEPSTWQTYFNELPVSNTIMPPINGDVDWHTRVTTFTLEAKSSYISLYLDNVKTGQVYIDQLSIQEIDTHGQSVGGELIRQGQADIHTYMEQRPSAFLDWQLQQGEQYGTYFKYVVQDKNDWVPNHLSRYGFFHDVGDGYYQSKGTKAHWFQQQWWRYLIARWGYSTAIHSWELNNEGSPHNASHYRATQTFAEFMHQQDSHPHLVSTSFWCCWSPQLWGDQTNYPDVDYADLHEYTRNSSLGDQRTALEQDMVALHLELTQKVKDTASIGKPVIRAETGISLGSENSQLLENNPNPGIWYHNLLWSQLDYSGVSSFNYWFSQHFQQIDLHYQAEKGRGESRIIISQPFFSFVEMLELNQGGYTEVETESDNANLRILGQVNHDTGQAHLWVQNKAHTWHNVMANSDVLVPQTGTIRLKIRPQTDYEVTWWDTYQGVAQSTEQITSDQDGWLKLTVDRLESDIAMMIE